MGDEAVIGMCEDDGDRDFPPPLRCFSLFPRPIFAWIIPNTGPSARGGGGGDVNNGKNNK